MRHANYRTGASSLAACPGAPSARYAVNPTAVERWLRRNARGGDETVVERDR